MNLSRVKNFPKEEAIPLVTFNGQTQKYTICEEALEFISALPGPLGVVAVAGMYRTGKSYLLNRMLLNRSSGFGVGPTVNPCTKGIWIWSKPLIGQTAEGDTINVLVMDSEGIGALDEDSAHDSRIFALAILLSSCFIYNSIGSIDENAIQNLSLVVNLTKNIHVKSQNSDSNDLDSEDYSNFFPSFIWVVRDFTLQLVDSENEPITSKEYLDRALSQQKGFSDSVESKNRIRRLLQTFFKERDCFTMVRPLMDEENLQNLDKLDFDKLRPEFFEQVIMMRKRVLNRIKPKSLNNKNLTGEMYVGLIKSYVSAINNGAVPNIENAWTYICKNECMKATYEAIETYDRVLKEILHNKLPMTFDELKSYHRMAKETALTNFKKKAIGDISDEFFKDIVKKIKQKFAVIKNENEKESQRVCTTFINQEFYTIERKLKNNEYKSFTEYERDIRLFYTYFMENGPKSVNKQVYLLEYLQKSLNDGANFFIRNINQEFEFQKTIKTELTKKLEQEIKELKEDNQNERTTLQSKITQLQAEKTEFELKEQTYKENLNDIRMEKEKLEKTLKSDLINERSDSNRLISDYKNKISVMEENIKEIERQNLFNQSETEKEKALYVQKISFLEKSLEDINRKEKDQANDMKNTKKEHFSQVKELSSKYEVLTKNQQNKINELQEKILEFENELATKDQKYEMERKKWNLTESNFNNIISDNNTLIQSLQREIRELKTQEEKIVDQFKNETEKNFKTLQIDFEKTKSQLKEKEDLIKQLKVEGQKEKAVFQQKTEFQELQLKELKKQLQENKESHEQVLFAFERSQQQELISLKTDNKQIMEIKENHKKEMKALENEFEAVKKRLGGQIDILTEKNGELELKLQFQTNDLTKEITNLKEQLEQSEMARTKLLDQNKTLDSQKMKMLKESEERYIIRIKQLENDLEDANQRSVKEIKDIQQKSEESLNQLKNFYEVERERLEKRLAEEKSRFEKRFSQTNEEFEQKMKEDQSNYEEEIENLKEDLHEQESQYATLMQTFEHEMAMKQQTIDNLDKQLKETKENLNTLRSSHNANMEQQMEGFMTERKGFIDKIENLNNEVYKKEKEIISLTQKKESVESMLAKKETQLEKAGQEFNEEKNILNTKMEEVKLKYQKLNDEYLEKKIEFGREFALSNQQNEFQTKKIEDMQIQLQSITERYEEKLKNQKNEIIEEMTSKISQSHDDKSNLELKYDKLKKTSKDLEADFNKQLSQLEKEKAIAQEKNSNLESKKAELEAKLFTETANFTNLITQNKEFSALEKVRLQKDVERYKEMFGQIEQDKNELSINYEKDKALWEGKFSFLEQQRDQAKQELNEAHKKFEVTLNSLKKAKQSEQEAEQNSSLNEMMHNMEMKHNAEISEISSNNQKNIESYEVKVRKLEKELKTANDKLLLDNHGKVGNQLMNEKKLSEFMENEKRLFADIDTLKQERDNKILEFQKMLDIEREKLKVKIQESEGKFKESESKRNLQMFDHEKERAKWSLEKDHIITQRNDLQEVIEKLEKKKDLLLRENEKLKNENKNSKKMPSVLHATVAQHMNNYLLNSGKNINMPQKLFQNNGSPMEVNNSESDRKSQKSSIVIEKNNLADITNFSSMLKLNGVMDMNKTMMSGSSTTEIEDIVERGVKFN